MAWNVLKRSKISYANQPLLSIIYVEHLKVLKSLVFKGFLTLKIGKNVSCVRMNDRNRLFVLNSVHFCLKNRFNENPGV